MDISFGDQDLEKYANTDKIGQKNLAPRGLKNINND